MPSQFQSYVAECIKVLASFPGFLSPNAVEGLVKLLRRMTSGGRLETCHFRWIAVHGAISRGQAVQQQQNSLLLLFGSRKPPDRCTKDIWNQWIQPRFRFRCAMMRVSTTVAFMMLFESVLYLQSRKFGSGTVDRVVQVNASTCMLCYQNWLQLPPGNNKHVSMTWKIKLLL